MLMSFDIALVHICVLVWACRFKSTELCETEVLQAGLSTDRILSFVKIICRLAGPGCVFLSRCCVFLKLLGSILWGLGRLWRPFGSSGRLSRFGTSFFHSFFDFWTNFGPPWQPKQRQMDPKERIVDQNDAQSVP